MPERKRCPNGYLVSVLAILACAFVGCRTGGRLAVTETGAPQYNQVNLVYELNGESRDIPLEAGGVAPASYSAASAKPGERWTLARLSIQYPHPDGMPGMARATLRLSGHTSNERGRGTEASAPLVGRLWELPELFSTAPESDQLTLTAARDDEVWVLDFPKPQLDLLLADLGKSGFFESQTRTDAGTRLEVAIDRGKTTKPWTPEPRLDDFIARVHSEGRLSGFISRSAEPHHVSMSAGLR